MALDRVLALTRFDPAVGLPQERPRPGAWNVIVADDLALLVPPSCPDGGSAALEALRRGHQNPYAELQDHHGVLAISPVRLEDGALQLAGGSHSTVRLHLEDGGPVVRKHLAVGSDPDPDRERHLRQVCTWLARLPAEVADLFPRVLRVREDRRELELVMEFVPGYSLAELVFQERLAGEDLASSLLAVYRTVRDRMWSRAPIELDVPPESGGYLARIHRRIAAIEASSYPADGPVRSVLSSRAVTVNGMRCTPVTKLLDELGHDKRWRPVVSPAGSALCHGDLTLEAVVRDDSPAGFCLLDPNPSNRHPVYDVFKTVMSLLLQYEFFYFDRFDVVYDDFEGEIRVEVAFEDAALQQVYARAGKRFLEFATAELAAPLGLPEHDVHSLLRMGAAVNMLALPMFHILDPASEPRALAFAAMGMWHAQMAKLG
jgi:hypothetical protein